METMQGILLSFMVSCFGEFLALPDERFSAMPGGATPWI
jgi:hypothetical protein